MKNLNEIELTPDVIAKIEECTNAEELVKLVAEYDVELSLEDAEKLFSDNSKMLIDNVLDKVVGGSGDDIDGAVACPFCHTLWPQTYLKMHMRECKK